VDPEQAEAFRKKAGLDRAATSVAELWEKENLDIVQICTPPAFHVDLSIQAMEAGACVLCEKPLCGSLAELHRIMDAEKRTGKWCASVFQMRYGAGTVHLQNLMKEGVLGAPLVGICHSTWYRNNAYYEVDWRGTWKNELGGPTVGHGIHAMDHFLGLLGDWSEVRADLGTLDRPIEVEDISMAIVRFANGAFGSIVNSVLSPREETYLRMDFQKATVELRHLYAYENKHWSFFPAAAQDETFAEKLRTISEGGASNHSAQLKALAADFHRGRIPQTSGPSAEATLDLLSSIYKSALTGTPVARGSIGKGDPFYEAFHGGGAVSHRLIASRKSSQ
jgi:predicted dehydrogenase